MLERGIQHGINCLGVDLSQCWNVGGGCYEHELQGTKQQENTWRLKVDLHIQHLFSLIVFPTDLMLYLVGQHFSNKYNKGGASSKLFI